MPRTLVAATDVQRSHGRITVTIPGAAELSDQVLIDSALHAARETRERIFGSEIRRHDEAHVTVALLTD